MQQNSNDQNIRKMGGKETAAAKLKVENIQRENIKCSATQLKTKCCLFENNFKNKLQQVWSRIKKRQRKTTLKSQGGHNKWNATYHSANKTEKGVKR